MPPLYADQTYWESRFKQESQFEWLGTGDLLLNHLRYHLKMCNEGPSFDRDLPRTLQIGAGNSHLDKKIINIYKDLGMEGRKDRYPLVVNTDFSSAAVNRANAKNNQAEHRTSSTVWEISDALNWQNVRDLLQQYGRFDAVVDKSTSDAISCGENIVLQYMDQPGQISNDDSINPFCVQHMRLNGDKLISLEPLHLLAIHMASLVNPGGVWTVLSYSANRFPFLKPAEADDFTRSPIAAGRWWRLKSVEEVEAPSGQGREGVHAPTVMHSLYVLERTEVSCVF
jgi:hypothetical protein